MLHEGRSMSRLKVVAVTANPSFPSRTLALAKLILDAVKAEADAEAELIELSKIGPLLGQSLARTGLPEEAERALAAVESADLLIAATPVYRGSYTGLFKHLFDLIDQNSLIDVPVILAATGGSDRHCLILEHQLRPLFGFFQAYTVPTTIYATTGDFRDGELDSELVRARIAAAARQALRLTRKRAHTAEPIAPSLFSASL
jgi:FMN reductase